MAVRQNQKTDVAMGLLVVSEANPHHFTIESVNAADRHQH